MEDMRKSPEQEFFYDLISTPLGEMRIIWTEKDNTTAVVEILLPATSDTINTVKRQIHQGAVRRSNPSLDTVCRQIQDYFTGNRVPLPLELLDMEQCYAFQKRVLLKAREIPAGKVTAYGRLADMIGAPRAARAVGTALARNPFPLILPCHRVIKAGGDLGRFGSGTDLKQALLQLEGVEVGNHGRIDDSYFW